MKEEEKPTNLSFTLRDGAMNVVGANTSLFHGVRAYFDGKYVKFASLDPEEQAKVKQAGKTGIADPDQ